MSDCNEQKTRHKVMENSDEITIDDPCTHCGSFQHTGKGFIVTIILVVTIDDPCTHCGSFQHTGKGFIVTIILVSLVSFWMCSLLLSVEHRVRSNLLS